MDGKTATMSIRAVEEVDGEGMTALTRRYECLFLGDLQGAVYTRMKGTTRRKIVLGRESMAGLGGRLCWAGRAWLDSEDDGLAVKILTCRDVPYTTSEQSWILTFGMSNQRRAGV